MTRKLTRRRQVKNRSKHSRNNKYKKTRRGKYIKKRRNVTRRRALRGGDQRHSPHSNHIIDGIVTAIANSSPERFKLLVDGLEIDPTILYDYRLQEAYIGMIQLWKDGALTGFLGLMGLKFLNYLWARVKLLFNSGDPYVQKKYENLQNAISLMDQCALAPGIKSEQLITLRKLSPNQYYYNCYERLFKQLSVLMSVESREIPLSSSACHLNDCNVDSCGSPKECCLPNGVPPGLPTD